MKTPLTDTQHRLLCESVALGHTPLFSGEVRAARCLVAKKFGRMAHNRCHWFIINTAGRRRVQL